MGKGLEDRLIIQLAKIPEEGLEIKENLPREWLTNIPEFADDSGPHLEGMIEVTGRLSLEGNNLRLTGAVKAKLATICSRCGKAIEHPLSGEFENVMVRGPAPEGEDEDNGRDDLRYFEGLEIDLNPYFQEEVALQVPIQTLCEKDCAGLCARCGADLNEGKCACPPEDSDPRLSALRNLKIN